MKRESKDNVALEEGAKIEMKNTGTRRPPTHKVIKKWFKS